ncbi:hypothetical protein GCM10020331_065260 [Ectobacillus funiculus]
MFLVPMLSIAIIVPLTVIAFGPFGVNVGNAIGAAIDFLSTKSGIFDRGCCGCRMDILDIVWSSLGTRTDSF